MPTVLDSHMQLTHNTLAAVAAFALSVSPARVAGLTPVPVCTAQEAVKVRKILAQNPIQPSCPDLKFNATGAVDLTDLKFCTSDKCVKTITKVKVELPKCKLNGVRVRTAVGQMLAACNGEDTDVEKTDREGNSTTATGSSPTCTAEQLKAAQSVIDQKLVATKCPEIVYVDGAPDYKNTAYCNNSACVAALSTTKKALPKCSYQGASMRGGTNKLLKACPKANVDDDDDTGGTATVAPSATKKPSSTSGDPETVKVTEGSMAVGAPIASAETATTGTPATSAPAISTTKTSSAMRHDAVAVTTVVALIVLLCAS